MQPNLGGIEFFCPGHTAEAQNDWYVGSQTTVALITAAIREIGSDKTIGRAQAPRHAEP